MALFWVVDLRAAGLAVESCSATHLDTLYLPQHKKECYATWMKFPVTEWGNRGNENRTDGTACLHFHTVHVHVAMYVCLRVHVSYMFVWVLRIMNFIMDLHLLTAISDMKSNGECVFYFKWEKEKKKRKREACSEGISRKRNLIRLFTKYREHMWPKVVCPRTWIFIQ